MRKATEITIQIIDLLLYEKVDIQKEAIPKDLRDESAGPERRSKSAFLAEKLHDGVGHVLHESDDLKEVNLLVTIIIANLLNKRRAVSYKKGRGRGTTKKIQESKKRQAKRFA